MCRREFGFVSGTVGTKQCTVKCEHCIRVLLREASEAIGDFEFQNWWRVNDTTIALSKATCPSSHWLLSDTEGKVQWRCLIHTWRWCKRRARRGFRMAVADRRRVSADCWTALTHADRIVVKGRTSGRIRWSLVLRRYGRLEALKWLRLPKRNRSVIQSMW